MQGTIKPAEQEGYITVIAPDESCDILVKHSLPVRQSVLASDVCKLYVLQNQITSVVLPGLLALLEARIYHDITWVLTLTLKKTF